MKTKYGNCVFVCVCQHSVLPLCEVQGNLFPSSKGFFHNSFVHVCLMCLILWFVIYLFFYLYIYIFFFFHLWCQDSAGFTNINYMDLGGPGIHGECCSPLSSIFIFCHFTQLQLPDAGDGGSQVNRYSVESADQFRPEPTKGSSLGHQGFLFSTDRSFRGAVGYGSYLLAAFLASLMNNAGLN